MQKWTKVLIAFLFSLSALSQPSVTSIESAFIYRIMHFISFSDVQENLKVCVYKDTAVLESLQKFTKDKQIKGHNLVLVNIALESSPGCHILFLGTKLTKAQLNRVRNKVMKNKVFTISRDQKNATVSMLNIKLINNNLKFDANKTLLSTSKVHISSKILRLADKVY